MSDREHPDSDPTLQLPKGPTYVYDDLSQTYVFSLKDGSTKRLSRGTVQAIITDYVEDGANMSIQEVCVAHGLDRWTFGQIKSALALTKRHEPFTLEELRDVAEDSLVERSLAHKRRRLARRADSVNLRQIRDMAAKWLRFEQDQLDPIGELFKRYLKEPPPPPVFTVPTVDEDAVIVHVHASDLHYGMLATDYGMRPYNRRIAAEYIMRTADRLIAWLGTFKAVDFVLLPCGGDWFHVDNIHGRTASFKHTMDCDGVPEEIASEGIDLYVSFVQRVLDAGYKVRIEVVPGNHDTILSTACGRAAALCFQHDSRVDVGNLISPYAYLLYGDTAIVMHHGHGLKSASSLGAVMDRWLRAECRTARHRYAVTGNLHHIRMEEGSTLILIQQPSPAGHDRFATMGGWVTSRPAVAMLAFSPTAGLTDTHMVYFD